MKTALILSGGGARAAYQIGVLRAVHEILTFKQQPFDIICGTSAGAINAAFMTAYAHRPRQGIVRLHHAWRSLTAQDVYDTSWWGVFGSLTKIITCVITGTSYMTPAAILDNTPLRELLTNWLDFDALRANLRNHHLHNLCITAMNYSTGESIAFYEGEDVEPWVRLHRRGLPTRLQLEHILASSAIPILFPPQALDGDYYGDGALRQLNPLSPALHLGAGRLFIIGVSSNRKGRYPGDGGAAAPSVAQMAGHLLNREFIDNLEADIEQAEVINGLLDDCALLRNGADTARKVDVLVITPSVAIDTVAARYIKRQPASMRLLFRILGAQDRGAGASFASYLLFDGGFCQELSDMGYRDAMDSADAIRNFFSGLAPESRDLS
jgi:NTE family protein